MSLEEFFQPTRSSFAIEGASHKATLVQSSLSAPSRSIDSIVEHDESPEPEVMEVDIVQDSQTSDATVTGGSDKENIPAAIVDPTPSLQRTSTSTSVASRPSRASTSFRQDPTVSTPSATPRSKVVQTIQTSNASWSPSGDARSTRPTTGRSQRADLRKRLEVFTSQSGKARTASPDIEDEEDELESDEDDELESEEREQGSEQRQMDGGEDEAIVVDESEQNSDDIVEEAQPASTGRARFRRHDAPRSRSSESSAIADVNMLQHTSTSSVPPASLAQDENMVAGPSRRRRSATAPDDITALEAGTTPHPETVHVRRLTTYREAISSTAINGDITLQFDIGKLRDRHRKRRRTDSRQSSTHTKDAYSVLSEGGVSSAAGISNKDVTSAGEALSRVISKADFQEMEVLGQFNKGFIIARLRHQPNSGAGKKGTDDLFIVDQHASDEKFNFETLQRTTEIKAQKLIR